MCKCTPQTECVNRKISLLASIVALRSVRRVAIALHPANRIADNDRIASMAKDSSTRALCDDKSKTLVAVDARPVGLASEFRVIPFIALFRWNVRLTCNNLATPCVNH